MPVVCGAADVMGAIYNEIEKYPAAWLQNLIDAGHIAPGRVDRRSIKDLEPADVGGPGQRHFFAGVGVWQYALRIAGVADASDIWTGSCPCQPFSSAGKRLGFDDERHLLPDWFALIRECRPAVIFGEQVAGPAGVEWLASVFADLEACGYACAGADLAAASIGAPHKRQRLFWVAHTRSEGRQRIEILRRGGAKVGRRSRYGSMGDADVETWSDPRWVYCDDPGGARWRPVEAGTFPLAPRSSGRMGRLRAYGNAIVAPLAAEFISASLEAMEALR